jgi:hypothetical protein
MHSVYMYLNEMHIYDVIFNIQNIYSVLNNMEVEKNYEVFEIKCK